MENSILNDADSLSSSLFPDPFFSNTRKTLDPIHGYIRFDNFVWKFVDNGIFQRLRDIKQVGGISLVFNGGSHTRFEHCLGVAHLAQKITKNIFKYQPNIRESFGSEEHVNQIKTNITVAGLLHDVGHGPYSHMFDAKVIPTLLPDIKWKHETGSSLLVEKIVDDNHIEIEREDVRMIQDLILANSSEKYKDHKWTFQIVANKETAIDVDRFDYVYRDSYHIGLKDTHFDYRTIIKEARVIDDFICFPAKTSNAISELFYARYKLFKNIYFNRSTAPIELMIAEALIYADEKFKFGDIIKNNDMDRYSQLTDHIIKEIEYADCSDSPGTKKAQEIIKRIRRRDIYKFAAETVSLNYDQKLDDEEKIKQDICSFAKSDGILSLKPENIELMTIIVDYGKKSDNPLTFVKYYNKNNIKESFNMDPSQISQLLPKKFIEKILRVYVKDQQYLTIATEAFKRYCKHCNLEVAKFESKQLNS